MSRPHIKVILFDVFGTLVDVEGSIVRALDGKVDDPQMFGKQWVATVQGDLASIREGYDRYENFDRILERGFRRIIHMHGYVLNDDTVRNCVDMWQLADAWLDVINGLRRLRGQFILAPLSNGNITMMIKLARHNEFIWDAIFGAEIAKNYKPNNNVYETAISALNDYNRSEILMVASHEYDLEAAANLGLQTAYIRRSNIDSKTFKPDYTVNNIEELADILVKS